MFTLLSIYDKITAASAGCIKFSKVTFLGLLKLYSNLWRLKIQFSEGEGGRKLAKKIIFSVMRLEIAGAAGEDRGFVVDLLYLLTLPTYMEVYGGCWVVYWSVTIRPPLISQLLVARPCTSEVIK